MILRNKFQVPVLRHMQRTSCESAMPHPLSRMPITSRLWRRCGFRIAVKRMLCVGNVTAAELRGATQQLSVNEQKSGPQGPAFFVLYLWIC